MTQKRVHNKADVFLSFFFLGGASLCKALTISKCDRESRGAGQAGACARVHTAERMKIETRASDVLFGTEEAGDRQMKRSAALLHLSGHFTHFPHVVYTETCLYGSASGETGSAEGVCECVLVRVGRI